MKKMFASVFLALAAALCLIFPACSEGVPYEVRYVKAPLGRDEGSAPRILKSADEFEDCIAAETEAVEVPVMLFEDDFLARYDDAFFEDGFVVAFMVALGSGSYGFQVRGVTLEDETLLIACEVVYPPPGTAVTEDMAYWYTFVELESGYDFVKTVELIVN